MELTNQLKNKLHAVLSQAKNKKNQLITPTIGQLTVGKSKNHRAGKEPFQIALDAPVVNGRYTNQSLTCTIFDISLPDMHEKGLRIKTIGRTTTIWINASNYDADLHFNLSEKKKPQDDAQIRILSDNFYKLYEECKPYLERPSLLILKSYLPKLCRLFETIDKLKMTLSSNFLNDTNLNLDDIQNKCFSDKKKGIDLIQLYEEIKLSKPRPLAAFEYFQNKNFLEKDLAKFGLFQSCTYRLQTQLAIPLYSDFDEACLVGFQTITPDGNKFYHIIEGVKSNGIFALLRPFEAYSTGVLTVCEGFATGISYNLMHDDANVVVALDANGLQACTKKFANRELLHALDNDSRFFSEKRTPNVGIETSLKCHGQIKRVAPVAPLGYKKAKIDYDDLRQFFKNDFLAMRSFCEKTIFSFNSITSLEEKGNYFIHTRFFSKEFFPDLKNSVGRWTISTNASTGTGKTTLLKSLLENKNQSVIYACPRVSLTNKTANDLNLVHYKDLTESSLENASIIVNSCDFRIASTMHSLWKIKESFPAQTANLDLLILDEVDQIFSDLKDFNKIESEKRLSALVECIKDAKHIILLSATMSAELLQKLRELRPHAENLHAYNTCTPARGQALIIKEKGRHAFFDKVVRAQIGQLAGRVSYTSDNAERLQQHYNDLKKLYPHKRILLASGKGFKASWGNSMRAADLGRSFQRDPDTFLEENKVDFLLYTPVLQTGFSIDLPFEKQFADFSLKDIQPKSQLQQLMRIRNVSHGRVVRCLDLKKENLTLEQFKQAFLEKKLATWLQTIKALQTAKQWQNSPKAQRIAQELLELTHEYQLQDEDKVIISVMHADNVEYCDYFQTFVDLLGKNGLSCSVQDGLAEESSGYEASKVKLSFVATVDDFLAPNDDEENQIKTFLEEQINKPLGISIKNTEQQLQAMLEEKEESSGYQAWQIQNILENPVQQEQLTIYSKFDKLKPKAELFLLATSDSFQNKWLDDYLYYSQNATNINNDLAIASFNKEILYILENEEADEALTQFMRNARRRNARRGKKVIKIDLLRGLFGIHLPRGQKIDNALAKRLANKCLRKIGLSIETLKNDGYMAFWQNFAGLLENDFDIKRKENFSLYADKNLNVFSEKIGFDFNKESTKENELNPYTPVTSQFEDGYNFVAKLATSFEDGYTLEKEYSDMSFEEILMQADRELEEENARGANFQPL